MWVLPYNLKIKKNKCGKKNKEFRDIDMIREKIGNLTEEHIQWMKDHPKELANMFLNRAKTMNKIAAILQPIRSKIDKDTYSSILWKLVDIQEENKE